jgi:hypothetical protein
MRAPSIRDVRGQLKPWLLEWGVLELEPGQLEQPDVPRTLVLDANHQEMHRCPPPTTMGQRCRQQEHAANQRRAAFKCVAAAPRAKASVSFTFFKLTLKRQSQTDGHETSLTFTVCTQYEVPH